MSDASVPPLGSSRANWHERVTLGAFVLILTLVMIRAPVSIDLDPGITYRTLLYESLRLGHAWGEQFITTDGPLGALQAPGYLKGSVWMAMVWQIAGNLLLSGLLVSAAFRLPRSSRWWALAFLVGILARVPVLAPWLAMVLLGYNLIHRRTGELQMIIPLAVTLGFLALSSLGHLLLGSLSLLFVFLTGRPLASKGAILFSFGISFLIGWMILGQSLSDLTHWLSVALSVLAHTSSLLRLTDTAPLAPWVGFATLALVTILLRRGGNAGDRRDFLPTALFLLGATLLAWKTIALQAYGTTETFFGTSLLAGFVFLYQGATPILTRLLLALALGGLIRGDPLLATDVIGQLNRQLVASVRTLATLSQLRSNLLSEIKGRLTPQALPRIKAAIGDATVDVLGDSPSRAILNGLNVRFRPVPLGAFLRSPRLAMLNAAYYMSPAAPAFVLQSFRVHDNYAPALEDAPAQLALYQNYDLQFEETGVMLWRKKNAQPAARSLVASGDLTFGEPLRLPATDAVYWLELDISPGLLGRAWALVDEIPDPGFLVRDTTGLELRYPLPTAVSGAGFLIEPFVRGEVDFIRRQSGANLPRVSEITLLPPPHGGWLWANHGHYRLYQVSGIGFDSSVLPEKTLETYRLLNRLPVGIAANFPFSVVPTEQNDSVLFAHPPSILEFAVTKEDHRLRARIGILPGALKGPHPTDGVDFSVEFFGEDGIRQVLYHRWLDPVGNPDDQGRQDFVVNLPASRSGRLFLRTYNAPGRNESYDWAFWSYVVIE